MTDDSRANSSSCWRVMVCDFSFLTATSAPRYLRTIKEGLKRSGLLRIFALIDNAKAARANGRFEVEGGVVDLVIAALSLLYLHQR